jgi:adenylosuccinate lyase
MSREAAYAVVQRHAMRSWEKGIPFMQLLLKDREVMASLTRGELDDVFDVKNFLGRIDFIFGRVFGDCQ